MTDFVKEYLNLIIFQYQDKPKFISELTSILNKVEEVKILNEKLLKSFDLDKAVGNQLDIIGRIVGLPRRTESIVPKAYFGFVDKNINALGFGGSFFNLGDELYSELVLNDSDYRFFIKCKIANNLMKNNIHSINEIIAFLFSDNAYVEDNRDTTFNLYINENVDFRLVQYAKSLNLLPRPQTIEYNLVRTISAKTFGFRDINPNAWGFGGSFSKILDF